MNAKTIKRFLTGTFSLGFIIIIFWCSTIEPSDNVEYKSNIVATPPVLPDSLDFCGESVPTSFFDVKESLQREVLVNVYWHSQTIWLIQKSKRYFPIIEPILKENNIPDDFKYLAVAESGLADVVSPSGAKGFWQLLEGTSKDYGLEINDEVDERYHLEKATEAACKYLNESYEKYGNWTMAAASYNVGRRGVDRQIDKQKETDYYNLLFNEETARYLYRILSFKLVFENPESFNFFIPEDGLYKPFEYKEVKVQGKVESWADFAKEHGTNYKMLKLLNPWLRESYLENRSGREYSIKVPGKNSRTIN